VKPRSFPIRLDRAPTFASAQMAFRKHLGHTLQDGNS
jgi:hypothetical protein